MLNSGKQHTERDCSLEEEEDTDSLGTHQVQFEAR